MAIFPIHDAIALADMARLAEERGHEWLFFPSARTPGGPPVALARRP
jgi:hypothetical protein